MILPPQRFETSDIPTILLLILLEGLLSADNALVLAMMVRHLAPELRKKALLYGLVGAFVFRAVAIILAAQILGFWWLQAIGALYLLFITIKHFRAHAQPAAKVPRQLGFWATVFAVELTDIAFAVDSVLAAVAFVKSQEKVWVIYVGAMAGVILLRFAAGVFTKLLDRFPGLEHVAYVIVGWVGIKLAMMASHHWAEGVHKATGAYPALNIPLMPPVVFWSVLGLIIVVGLFVARKSANAERHDAVNEA